MTQTSPDTGPDDRGATASPESCYLWELEAALRDLLDAMGGSCPSHGATEEGCPACHAAWLLDGGFRGSVARQTRR